MCSKNEKQKIWRRTVSDLVLCESYWDAYQLDYSDVYEIEFVKIRSLLCRLFGQIDEEMDLIQRALEQHPEDNYLKVRFELSKQPLHQRLVSRKLLQTVDLRREISQEIDRLCFVSASDDQYYSLLSECLESITQATAYTNIPIFVIDCGLSDISKENLLKQIPHLQLIDVWQILESNDVVLTASQSHLCGILCRAFFRDLIPSQYRYCFWIDADAWLQDTKGISTYVTLAKRQGIALPIHPFNVNVKEHHHWLHRGTLTSRQKEVVLGYPAVIACCFCVDIESDIYIEYSNTVLSNIHLFGTKWGIDQDVFLYISAKYKLELLPSEYAFEGHPVIAIDEDGAHMLFTPTNELIKVFHLGGGIKEKNRKWRYFIGAEFMDNGVLKGRLRTSDHFRGAEWKDRGFLRTELMSVVETL